MPCTSCATGHAELVWFEMTQPQGITSAPYFKDKSASIKMDTYPRPPSPGLGYEVQPDGENRALASPAQRVGAVREPPLPEPSRGAHTSRRLSSGCMRLSPHSEQPRVADMPKSGTSAPPSEPSASSDAVGRFANRPGLKKDLTAHICIYVDFAYENSSSHRETLRVLESFLERPTSWRYSYAFEP